MSATFQLGSLLGIVLGYFLCIGQAKLTLAIYRRSPDGQREEADRLHAAWVAQHPPSTVELQTPVEAPSFDGDERSLRKRWNMPGPNRPTFCEPLSLSHPELIRTRRCPNGFSAANILGYREIGRPPTPSLFPGGLDAWPY